MVAVQSLTLLSGDCEFVYCIRVSRVVGANLCAFDDCEHYCKFECGSRIRCEPEGELEIVEDWLRADEFASAGLGDAAQAAGSFELLQFR